MGSAYDSAIPFPSPPSLYKSTLPDSPRALTPRLLFSIILCLDLYNLLATTPLSFSFFPFFLYFHLYFIISCEAQLLEYIIHDQTIWKYIPRLLHSVAVFITLAHIITELKYSWLSTSSPRAGMSCLMSWLSFSVV